MERNLEEDFMPSPTPSPLAELNKNHENNLNFNLTAGPAIISSNLIAQGAGGAIKSERSGNEFEIIEEREEESKRSKFKKSHRSHRRGT